MESMIKTDPRKKVCVDLITGFLGAGKTTFIKKYLNYCSQKCHENVIVVENEFGRAGIDAEILEDAGAHVTQLAGGCICCGLKVNFHDLLIELSTQYDRIIVEPSGIYTLEDFYDIMDSPRISAVLEIGTVLTILDPSQLEHMDKASETVIYSQLDGTGQIIISKSGIRPVRRQECVKRLNNILHSFGNTQRDADTFLTLRDWDAFTDEDFRYFRECGYFRNERPLAKQDHSTLFFNTTVAPCFTDSGALEVFIRMLTNGTFGQVIRVKGHLTCSDGTYYEINCTPDDYQVMQTKTQNTPGLNIIGKSIDRKGIREYIALSQEHDNNA